MKMIGEMLSVFFDKTFLDKANGLSRFFDSWTDITEKNGIASAASYSRIKDLVKGIVIIEMDHPGWKQILQTKQSKLLYDFRYRFPDMDITGISLILAAHPEDAHDNQEITKVDKTALQDSRNHSEDQVGKNPKNIDEEHGYMADQYIPSDGFNAINDDKLKDTLIRIGELIQKREKS